MLKSLLSDLRVWLLAALLLLVLVLTRWSFQAGDTFKGVVYGGYWLMLALSVLFCRACIPVIREHWRKAGFGYFEVWVFAGVLLTTAIWTAQEKPGFKVLADELLLLGTSMGMHYDREAAYPMRATDVQGSFQILNGILDKRPILFPFLVATLHDLTGYRPENSFYLNMALGVGFLWLAYLVGWNAGQARWAGVLAVLLLAGLPLLAQQATGGGFELLNLVLIAAFALLMVRYLEQPEETRLEALIFGSLLLASTRYESALFLLPATAAAVWGWYRAGRVILTGPLLLSPLFLAPILIQNRIFSGQSQAWQMASLPGITEPFGFQYLAPNLGHALAFFFDFTGYQPNSPLLAVTGLLALPFFALWGVRVFRRSQAYSPSEQGWALVGMSLFAVTAIYLFYFWGQFDQPIIRRLSLPVHFLMVIAIIVTGKQLFVSARGWKIASLFALGGILFHSLPVMAKQAYRTSYSPGVEMQIRSEFLNGLLDKNLLFLDNDSFFWITHKISASPVKEAQMRKEGLAYHLRNRSFTEIYVFQSILVDDKTGSFSIDPVDDLGADFELEPVLERKVQTLLFARISRVKAIKDGKSILGQASRLVTPVTERRTTEELDGARALYLENWIKKLP